MGYPKTLLVRTVNPGTVDEFLIVGQEPSEVADTAVSDRDSLDPKAARYVLAGVGSIHHSAPQYVEDAKA